MKKEKFTADELPLLQNGKENICVSVIVPTHRLSPDRRTDQLQLEKAIQQAKNYLHNQYPGTAINSLLEGLDELYDQVDFIHNAEGIGLFVSAAFKKLVHYFFPVKEKVIIGDLFQIRDWLYQADYNIPYYTLLLSEKEAKLCSGIMNKLTAITDEHFPQKNEAAYEYSRPTRGSSYVGHAFVKEFEKDKSIMEEIRLEAFFRVTDELLNNYLHNGTPLIVTGEKKDLSSFKNITQHEKNIAGYIHGNYSLSSENELGNLTWNSMKQHIDKEKLKLINDFKEKTGEGLGVSGIQNIWKAVMEGRGFKLLVEKDYVCRGFIKNNDEYHLHLDAPVGLYHVLTDAVNNIIEMVLEKKGEVIIVENDMLQNYEPMVLITRY